MQPLKLELELGAKMTVILWNWHRKQTKAIHSYKNHRNPECFYLVSPNAAVNMTVAQYHNQDINWDTGSKAFDPSPWGSLLLPFC